MARDVDAAEVAAGTKRLYRFATESYILPGVGNLRLREITVPVVERLLASVRSNRGPGAAKSTRNVLAGILGTAVHHGRLPGLVEFLLGTGLCIGEACAL